jgi:hypothetical protein
MSKKIKIVNEPEIAITRDHGFWCFHVGSHIVPISVNGRPCWRDTASAVNVVPWVKEHASGRVKVIVEYLEQ